MFCTNCGNKLENGASFCTRCGCPVEVQPGENQAAAEGKRPQNMGGRPAGGLKAASQMGKKVQNGAVDSRWIDWGLYGLCGLAAVMGLMKWIQISVPFVDELNGSWHLWNLVSFLKELGAWANTEEIVGLSVLVAIPLLLWGAGILLGIAGTAVSEALKNKKAGRICLGVASMMLAASGGLYLMMVYWLKNEINRQVSDYIGIGIGGGIIKVPVWPKLMVLFGAAGLLMAGYGCYLLFRAEKTEGSKSLAPAVSGGIPMQPAEKPFVRPQPTSHGGRPTAPGMGGLLVLQEANNPDKVYGCDLEHPAIAGRDASSCNVVIMGDKSISRQHCRFYLNGGRCCVEDLQSFNHTYLNGTMVTRPMVLKTGDRLTLGNLHLIVVQCDIE